MGNEKKAKKESKRLEWMNFLDEELGNVGIELDKYENLLVAFECAAQHESDNQNYGDKPDWVLTFRHLRKGVAELQEKVLVAFDRILDKGAPA